MYFRMRARAVGYGKDKNNLQTTANSHKEDALGHMDKPSSPEFHTRSFTEHQKRQTEAQEKAAKAESLEEKEKWNRIRIKHIACSAWHLGKL